MASKKKKTPKTLNAISLLTAFQATYKAACRKHGVTLDKSIQAALEEKLETGKAFDKVTFQGPEITSANLSAVLDAMAGYPSVKNLCCWNCNIGDQGLLAVSQLLQSSGDKTWRGSKLRLLEITNDGDPYNPQKWGERYMAMVQGETGLPTLGASFRMPSLVLGEAAPVSPATVIPGITSGSAAAVAGLAEVERRFSNLQATSSRPTTISYMESHYVTPLNPTGTPGGSPAPPPPAPSFGYDSLYAFSRALGTMNLALQVLVLDHNHLGDDGMKRLATGLKRCSKLKTLSVSNCGVGGGGASALNDTLVPDEQDSGALLQPRYVHINLSRNPLGGAGLSALCPGVSACASLKVLNLSDCGISELHLPAIQSFAEAVGANTSLEQVDFNVNFIGDKGASLLVPMLANSPHIKKFRLTSHLSRDVGQQIASLLKEHSPKKKGVKKKKKKA